jgi:hypothetical protein
VSLPASMMVGLGGVVPQSLDEGHVLRCARRVEVSVGIMVAPSAGSVKLMWILTLKMARWFDGGDDSCSVYTRYSLSLC